MKGIFTLARAIAFIAILSFLVPAYATLLLLTEGFEIEEYDDTNTDKSLLPFVKPDSRKKKRNQKKSKELLSLLWKDGDSSPFSFSTKAIKPNINPWSSFWGGIIHHRHRNDFQDDRERIRQTLRKFYRLPYAP